MEGMDWRPEAYRIRFENPICNLKPLASCSWYSMKLSRLIYLDAQSLIDEGTLERHVSIDFLSNLTKNDVRKGLYSVAKIRTEMTSICKLLKRLVPRAGVEPAPSYEERILSPQRLPFRHPGTNAKIAC